MRVIDVCSGIGTTAVAWHSLGWEHLCFAEIEKFPSAVLKHRWPGIVNEGDFTQIGDKYHGSADLLVGGTPCQSFSVAGLRGGLADDRGNLALEFLRLADRTRPRWVVWENVPGVLSSNGGRDFGSILGGLGQLGYGWAYRILDAQYAGVPQRRRRVFVVGHLGDWRAAAAVLFERHSLQGNHPPRREKGERVAPTINSRPSGGGGLGTDFDLDGGLISGVTHSLRADGFDASEDGTGRGTPLVPICWDEELNATEDQSGSILRGGDGGRHAGVAIPTVAPCLTGNYGKQPDNSDTSAGPMLIAFSAGQSSKAGSIAAREEQSPTLRGAASGTNQVPAIAFTQNQRDEVRLMDVAGALASEPGMKQQTYVHGGMAVRRLTPRECERQVEASRKK